MKRLLPILIVLSLCACGKHTLFEAGESAYTIVIDPAAPETEQYAASELQYWIQEVGGVKLPIAGLSDGIPGKRLVVGWNSLVKGMERPEDGDDAFTYRSSGGDVFFLGGSKRGTLYAVYSFLEKELGCRWYSSKVSVAPPRDTYVFGKLFNHEEPGILIRDNCVLDVRSNPVFSARMRNNFIKVPSSDEGNTVPGSAEGYWGVHALGYHVPSAKYYSTHPEYFALRDGKRQSGYAQPCLSNPDVLAITIESLRNVMRSEPDYLIYSVEQCDNQLYCECEECEALAVKYGGQSGVMIWFVNQVADAVRDEFPDKFVGTFAYQYTRHAPEGIVPRDNVVVRLCSIECCMIHDYDKCERNLDFVDDLSDWGRIAPHLYIWDYVTDFAQYCLPVANWKTMQPHIRDFRGNHAIGILEEGDYQTPSCELREMRSWILSKLMWDPDADVEALIRDFTDGYYGAGGPFVREYLELEERILRRPGIHAPCYVTAADSMYTYEFIDEGRAIFSRAREAVRADSTLIHRLESAEWPLCFLQMENTPVNGFKTGADRLIRRVIERDGITRLAEGDWSGGKMQALSLLNSYDVLARTMKNTRVFHSRDVETEGNGVRFIKYEGDFLSTTQMLREGKKVGEGVLPAFRIETEPEKDHFGYEFESILEVPEGGLRQIKVTSDDGFVMYLDDEMIISLDGSHSPLSGWSFVNLEAGKHKIRILYFEDCEGQVLNVDMGTPDGYYGPIKEEYLWCEKR